MFQGAAGEARQNQRFLGPDIVQNPNDLDLKLLYLIAREHSSTDAAHPGAHFAQRKERSLRGKSGGQRDRRRDHEAGHIPIVPVAGKKIPAKLLTAGGVCDTM